MVERNALGRPDLMYNVTSIITTTDIRDTGSGSTRLQDADCSTRSRGCRFSARSFSHSLLNRVCGKPGILVIDYSLLQSVGCGSLDQQLHSALLVQGREKVSSLIYGIAQSQ